MTPPFPWFKAPFWWVKPCESLRFWLGISSKLVWCLVFAVWWLINLCDSANGLVHCHWGILFYLWKTIRSVYLAHQVVTMLGQLNGSLLWSQLPSKSSGSVFHLSHPSHGDCKFPIDPPWRTLGLDYINLQTFLLCGSVSKYLCSISNPNSCPFKQGCSQHPSHPRYKGWARSINDIFPYFSSIEAVIHLSSPVIRWSNSKFLPNKS